MMNTWAILVLAVVCIVFVLWLKKKGYVNIEEEKIKGDVDERSK